VSDAILNEFRHFLNSNKIEFEEADFTANLDFIKREIKYEYVLARFGLEDSQKVRLEGDPQVAKALEVLPQAKALFQNARKVMASKKSAGK